MRLNFTETHIIMVLRIHKDRTQFMNMMSELQKNTTEPLLLRELEGLSEKLLCLSDDGFNALLRDAEQGVITFPSNYALPHL